MISNFKKVKNFGKLEKVKISENSNKIQNFHNVSMFCVLQRENIYQSRSSHNKCKIIIGICCFCAKAQKQVSKMRNMQSLVPFGRNQEKSTELCAQDRKQKIIQSTENQQNSIISLFKLIEIKHNLL